jgi:hypothetical protein
VANRRAYCRRIPACANSEQRENTTDYGIQMEMFRMYITERYQRACCAEQFWKRNHWY